ncbi:MAG: glucose 1-dehydrogenase [Candidatus Marinimicrobia bacterium]|nr:glucose 1-dehydrogenase [Candidatus Neomarinimicrobiota bacterium]MCF7840472.1 glucose 1-dehydrogenase [Candidatus Neomarinimicrobiota bacterium]
MLTHLINLTGQIVLITGGSRGIGAAAAKIFAQAGADVAITCHKNTDAARKVAAEVADIGRRAIILTGDVADPDVAKQHVALTLEQLGRLDVLVNNAGIWNYSTTGDTPVAVWDELMAINLRGVFNYCNAAVPVMRRQKGGNIVNVSSTAGQRGEAFHSHYAASKGGMNAYTKSLSTELAPYNIRVNAVAPGWVDTGLNDEVFADPSNKEAIRNSIPLERIASAEDIAAPIVFLASEMARHITGEILNVNGGSVLCG